MKYNDFKSIMKTFEVDNVIFTSLGNKGYLQYIYLLRDCGVYYSRGKAVVVGKIPLSLANIIWENTNDSENYSIRIGVDGNYNGKPEIYAVDDIFEKDIMKLKKANLGACEYVQKCEEVSERLHQRSDENKYIKSYNISNILDFSFFLVMMKDYYNENNKSISNSVIFQKK